MINIDIALGRRSYQIFIGPGLLNRINDFIEPLKKSNRCLVVTNPLVDSLYAGAVANNLAMGGLEVHKAVVPDGEEYKNLAEAEKLYDLAYALELDRQSVMLAVGGGVIGDLTGFVASTYLRGVPFIQVPTTLLAQVDSSVGGKVAVNHPRGKNIIGSFYQPRMVISDTTVLKTLDKREIRAGMAEVIKYGIIWDESFFAWLEENLEGIMTLNDEEITRVVATSCRIKAQVVQEDETEQDKRAILNFGHTVGHAIEALTKYKVYHHGEAVAIGMMAACRLARSMGLIKDNAVQRAKSLIKRCGLPTDIPGGLSPDDLMRSMHRDKKVISGSLTFVLPTAIGKVGLYRDISPGLLIETLKTPE